VYNIVDISIYTVLKW